jgi:hypothetical protein
MAHPSPRSPRALLIRPGRRHWSHLGRSGPTPSGKAGLKAGGTLIRNLALAVTPVIASLVLAAPAFAGAIVDPNTLQPVRRGARAGSVLRRGRPSRPRDRRRRAGVRVRRPRRRNRGRLRQPLCLGAHDHGAQGHPMARLPRPDRRLRRCRVAVAAQVIGPVATRFLRARPRGFEPLTFGSVDRRGSAKFGSSKPDEAPRVAESRPKVRIALQLVRRRLAGLAGGHARSSRASRRRACANSDDCLSSAAGVRSAASETTASR